MEDIQISVICPACKGFVAHYNFSKKSIGKTWDYRCPNCNTRFSRRIPSKSDYHPELTG